MDDLDDIDEANGVEHEAERLLSWIEHRVRYLAHQSRRTVELFFGYPPSAASVPVGTGLDARALERFAPHWAAAVPPSAELRGHLAQAMVRRYGPACAQLPRLRAALGLDDSGVRAALVRELGEIPVAPLADVDALTPTPAPSLVEAVESDLEWVSLTAGQTLFQQGDPGDGVYLVVDGRLRILAEQPDGSRILLGESGRGEMIGEMALLTSEPRSATVEALRDTNLIRLSTNGFQRLVERYPAGMLHIARMLVQRERRRTSGRTQSTGAATFAILARGPGLSATRFCEHLVRCLAVHGPTLHLSAERFDALMEPGLAQTPPDSVDHSRVAARLAELESHYAYLVYETDTGLSHWTRRCVRQADRLVLVTDIQHVWTPGPEEAELVSVQLQGRDLVLLHPNRQDRPTGTAAHLASLPAAHHHHVCLDSQSDFERLARWLTGHAVGLVLGGGGARGYVHIGVIAALREAGVPVDAVGGTSIGAVLAAEVALEWSNQTMRRIGRRFAVDHRPSPNVTLPLVALSTGESVTAALNEAFGPVRIEDLWIPYFAASSDLTTGEVVVHRRGSLATAVRASLSVPGILPPVTQAGHLLIDGGVLDNLPTDVMQRLLERGRVIGVDCNPTRGLHALSDYGATLTARQLVNSWLNPLVPSLKVWGIYSILDRVTMLGSIQQATEIARSIDLYLHPSTDGVGMYDSRGFDRLVDVGYKYALPIVRGWWNQLNSAERSRIGDISVVAR